MSGKLKDYLSVGLIYGAVAVLAVVVIIPALGVVFKEREDLVSDRQKLASLTSKAEFLESLNGAETRSKVAAATLALPSSKNSFGMVSGLENLAATVGGTLTSLTFSPGVLASGSGQSKAAEGERALKRLVRVVPFEIGFGGSFGAVRDFLSLTYQSKRLMTVEKVTFAEGLTQIKMGVYFQEPRESLGDPELPLDLLTDEQTANLQKVDGFNLVTVEPALTPTGKTNLFGQ